MIYDIIKYSPRRRRDVPGCDDNIICVIAGTRDRVVVVEWVVSVVVMVVIVVLSRGGGVGGVKAR